MPGYHRTGVVAELPAAMLALGVDPTPVLAAAGFPPDGLHNPDAMIPWSRLDVLFECAVAATAAPHLGLEMGLRGGPASVGIVGQLMATAPTMREAMLDLCTNQVRYIDGAVAYLIELDDVALWGYLVQTPVLRSMGFIQDGAVGVAARCIHQLSGHRPEAVRLSHAAPPDPTPYRRGLGVMPQFDAEQTCVVVSRAVLDAPVRSADAALRRLLHHQVAEYWTRAQPSVGERVRRAVAAYLTTTEVSLDRVAADLELGPRTLNRRLQLEGTSFRAQLDLARHDVACQLLGGTRMSVTDISAALGYATPPGFVRAFRRLAGLAPSEWRRAQAAPLAMAAR